MIWLAVAMGLMVAAFGATSGAALITVSRAELTRAVSRRLSRVSTAARSGSTIFGVGSAGSRLR